MIKKYIAYSCIILAIIMVPLFSGGYIITFDMPWGPHLTIVDADKYTYPLHILIDSLSQLVPGWIVQLFVLSLIIVLSFLGILLLLNKIIDQNHSSLILLGASVLYVFNPFFYTRFVAGQWLVLLGYAILPWAIRAFFLFLMSPTFKTAWPVAAWTAAIGLTSIHTIGIIFVAFVALAIYTGRTNWKQKLKWVGAVAVVWCVVNATWLIPLATGQSSVSDDIKNFSRSEMEAFATHGIVLDSPAISAALLTGFWADDTNRYILPSHLPIWWIGVFIIMTLVIIGIVQVVRKRDKLGYTFITLGFVAWVLGVGIAWSFTAPVTDLLIKIIPYYNGYREPHKWLMLLALVYAYLVAIGAQWTYVQITRYKSVWLTYGFVTILFITPFLYAPTLAWGAAGQLRSVQYPREWQQAKSYLNAHADSDTKILVLPWHMYLPISFAGRVVGNPAGYYFDQRMITGNNFELDGVPDQRVTPLTNYVNTQIARSDTSPSSIGENLNKFGVEYILLLKEADWKDYIWLNNQRSITPVITNDKIILYKITRTK